MAADAEGSSKPLAKSNSQGMGLERLAAHVPLEEFRKIADMRRSIWNYGLVGMVAGGGAGAVCFAIARRVRPGKWQWGKHGWLAVLGTSSFTCFVAARGRAAQGRSIMDDIRARQASDRAAALKAVQNTFNKQVVSSLDNDGEPTEQLEGQTTISGVGGDEPAFSRRWAERRNRMRARGLSNDSERDFQDDLPRR